MENKEWFRICAHKTAEAAGSPVTFSLAVFLIVVWLFSGPIFNFSDTWQLVINTGTTIITFLMVFLIQNSQNRDSSAVHIKLDELIRAVHGARTELVDLESLSDQDIKKMHDEFHALHEKLAKHLDKRKDRAKNKVKRS